jgi:hypothetical protein
VRDYGLFAANAFFEEGAGGKPQGDYILKPNESITLRYRIYCHAGDPKQAKVDAVYAGYSTAEVNE